MKKLNVTSKNYQNFFLLLVFLCAAAFLPGCKQQSAEQKIKQLDPAVALKMAASIDSLIKPELADDLTLSLWGVDSLVISPIAIDIDDDGSLYYTTTNRQKNSEFDIRSHKDWEIPSIHLQTIEEKRACL